MDTFVSKDNTAVLSIDNTQDQFERYARGRLKYFWRRQVLVGIGAAYLALFASPFIAILAAVIAVAGEVIDCGNLYLQRNALARGVRFARVSLLASVTAAIQAITISVCILLAWFSEGGDVSKHFATVFMMSAALNAGMVWPYHKASATARLIVFGVTLAGLLTHQFATWDRSLEEYLAEVITIFLMCYLVFIILQHIIGSYERQRRSKNQILATSRALAASDRLKRVSQEEARRLSLVARHANDSIVISAPDGQILWVNEAFSRITGYSSEEAIGQLPSTLLNDEKTCEETVHAIATHVQQGRPIRTEVLNKRKDGEKIWVETNIVPIGRGDGTIEMVVAIERDITAIKDHERELAEAKILAERGEQSRSEFLATMSHEIRTPMNGIIGLSDLLAEQDLPEDVRKYVATIKNSADALLAIINDILDFSKLDAGKLSIDPVEFDLRACFANAVELLDPQAQEKGIFLDVIEDQPLPTLAVGDDGRVRQIFLNMIGNAIKFTSKGGVTLTTRVQETEDSFKIGLDIKDTGIGIEQNRISQIFDKFQQADGKTTRKFGGTGLGLSISKQLAEHMEGGISVVSTVNKGSTFTVELVMGKPRHSDNRSEVAKREKADIVPMSILVAEDNKTNRFLINKFLQDLPVDLSFAHNGREAVEYTRERAPDLIFMDMSMPEMDGLEATQRIREMGGAQPHIIALTANAFASDREACFQVGMNDFLAKPVKKADLLSKLSEFSATL
ncbi:response regulator [Planktotalea sp.]|uniref:PAS domain-containing hybrid sensor histidine kinase/response regulator n=1 Tax=Planktotalea sp. TaxID=2029877 RepID=UPI003298BB84